MHTRKLIAMLNAVILVLAGVPVVSAFAHDSALKSVNGVSVYLNVMSAGETLGLPELDIEAKMHGGLKTRAVVVTLIDTVSGKRIGGAKVIVRVHNYSRAGSQKRLTPMTDGTVAYRNNFIITEKAYRIRVLIEIPGRVGVIDSEFDYQNEYRVLVPKISN